MAKFGETTVEYDPFNAISDTLKALNEPVPEPSPPDPKPVPQKQPAPESRNQRHHEAKPARQSVVEESGGGGKEAPDHKPTARKMNSSLALVVNKRFKTTHDESKNIDQATIRLSSQLGIRLEMSKITRALWEVYIKHEDDILRSMSTGGPTERPSNTDPVALAEFDEQLAEMIAEGLRLSGMRSRRS